MVFIGLVLMLYEISIYRQTIIDIYIPISIIIVVGSLAFYFNRQHFKKTYSLTGDFLPLMQNIISYGSITCYIFMAANYYLANSTTTEYRFPIKEKSSMIGPKHHRKEKRPSVTIDYFKFEKELVFRYEDTDKVEKADSVTVTVRKGRFGFDIFDNYDAF